MKSAIILLVSFFTVSLLNAQVQISTDLNRITETETSLCVSVDLLNVQGVAMRVEGQNIRLYYDSEKLQFDKVFMDGKMRLEDYEYELQMDRAGLSKDEVNQLAFDDHMGFLNFAVTARDVVDNQRIIENGQLIHAQTICFTKMTSEISSNDIVLARKGITDGYSQAFVAIEASPVNDEILLPMSLMQVDQAKVLAGLDD